ncbi:unnamed protein product, partial [Amoebophrya sp. A25]
VADAVYARYDDIAKSQLVRKRARTMSDLSQRVWNLVGGAGVTQGDQDPEDADKPTKGAKDGADATDPLDLDDPEGSKIFVRHVEEEEHRLVREAASRWHNAYSEERAAKLESLVTEIESRIKDIDTLAREHAQTRTKRLAEIEELEKELKGVKDVAPGSRDKKSILKSKARQQREEALGRQRKKMQEEIEKMKRDLKAFDHREMHIKRLVRDVPILEMHLDRVETALFREDEKQHFPWETQTEDADHQDGKAKGKEVCHKEDDEVLFIKAESKGRKGDEQDTTGRADKSLYDRVSDLLMLSSSPKLPVNKEKNNIDDEVTMFHADDHVAPSPALPLPPVEVKESATQTDLLNVEQLNLVSEEPREDKTAAAALEAVDDDKGAAFVPTPVDDGVKPLGLAAGPAEDEHPRRKSSLVTRMKPRFLTSPRLMKSPREQARHDRDILGKHIRGRRRPRKPEDYYKIRDEDGERVYTLGDEHHRFISVREQGMTRSQTTADVEIAPEVILSQPEDPVSILQARNEEE